MKTNELTKLNWAWSGLVALTLIAGSELRAAASAGQATEGRPRIGVYDSRAVAYAHFWTDEHQRALKEQAQAAKTAQAAGDTSQAKTLQKALADQQHKIHRQVFSTAPAAEALAAIQPRIPEIQKQAGVTALVSKWDEPALKSHETAERVDVTGLLVGEFKPSEKQRKVIEAITAKPPVPLEQIDKLGHE